MNELLEIPRHRSDIMRYQYASFRSGDLEYCESIFPGGSHLESLQEAYAGFATSYSKHYRSPQIFVRQEFDFQAEASSRRARSKRSRKAAGIGG